MSAHCSCQASRNQTSAVEESSDVEAEDEAKERQAFQERVEKLLSESFLSWCSWVYCQEVMWIHKIKGGSMKNNQGPTKDQMRINNHPTPLAFFNVNLCHAWPIVVNPQQLPHSSMVCGGEAAPPQPPRRALALRALTFPNLDLL